MSWRGCLKMLETYGERMGKAASENLEGPVTKE
jgi:hypothetical protein